jgi:SAM-dependent methyltransferase
MHAAAYAYAARKLAAGHYPFVVEVGGRDINGGVRALFTCDAYVSIDLEPGPGVDVVGDALDWRPPGHVDLVICCEVLEHEARQEELLRHMLGWLAPGGALLVTAGGPGREPHSGHDGGRVRPDEHYGNLDPALLQAVFEDAALYPANVEYAAEPRDTYGWGVKQ